MMPGGNTRRPTSYERPTAGAYSVSSTTWSTSRFGVVDCQDGCSQWLRIIVPDIAGAPAF